MFSKQFFFALLVVLLGVVNAGNQNECKDSNPTFCSSYVALKPIVRCRKRWKRVQCHDTCGRCLGKDRWGWKNADGWTCRSVARALKKGRISHCREVTKARAYCHETCGISKNK